MCHFVLVNVYRWEAKALWTLPCTVEALIRKHEEQERDISAIAAKLDVGSYALCGIRASMGLDCQFTLVLGLNSQLGNSD